MNRSKLLLALGLGTVLCSFLLAADMTKIPFDTYSGYFVSNRFEPGAKESFVVISSQEDFDQVFGVAFVMQDRSHRLPKDAFKSNLVVAVIKRGNAFCEYKVESVTVEKGVIQLRYTVTSKPTPETTFACPPSWRRKPARKSSACGQTTIRRRRGTGEKQRARN